MVTKDDLELVRLLKVISKDHTAYTYQKKRKYYAVANHPHLTQCYTSILHGVITVKKLVTLTWI